MKKKEKEKDMETEEIISKLEAKGIKPTSNRILVMKALSRRWYRWISRASSEPSRYFWSMMRFMRSRMAEGF